MTGLHFQNGKNGSKVGDKVTLGPEAARISDKTDPLFKEASQTQGLDPQTIAFQDEVIQAKLRALLDKNAENKLKSGPGKPQH